MWRMTELYNLMIYIFFNVIVWFFQIVAGATASTSHPDSNLDFNKRESTLYFYQLFFFFFKIVFLRRSRTVTNISCSSQNLVKKYMVKWCCTHKSSLVPKNSKTIFGIKKLQSNVVATFGSDFCCNFQACHITKAYSSVSNIDGV